MGMGMATGTGTGTGMGSDQQPALSRAQEHPRSQE